MQREQTQVVTEQTAWEYLFSYGTLRLASVQLATFGRLLQGAEDSLSGFRLAQLKIEDENVIAISGKDVHTIAQFTGKESDVIRGTVFRLTRNDIFQADEYEVAACKRVAVILQSGKRAWVYVDREQAP